MAKSMLAMKANKKLVQNHLMKGTGKVVLLKDLHNIAATLKHSPKNRLTELISQMKMSPGNIYKSRAQLRSYPKTIMQVQ